jgi:glycosyltransferase involved in cell wall biosynthesis
MFSSKKNQEKLIIIAKGSGFWESYSAVNTKCYYLAKILQECKCNVLILSSIYYHINPNFLTKGKYKEINYFAPSVFKPTKSKLKKFFNKIYHNLHVTIFLIKTSKIKEKIIYIYDDNSIFLPILLTLKYLSIIELVYNIEEWPIAHNSPIINRFYSHIISIASIRICDRIICVSYYLSKLIQFYNKDVKTFILPAITEFNINKDFPTIQIQTCAPIRFLYCGNVGYFEVIEALIKAITIVSRLRLDRKVELILILHGEDSLMLKVASLIKDKESIIIIKSKLSDSELSFEYSKASCLLAPLRDTEQDKTRFPQKISEYTSMSKPIITNNIGDIDRYFKDKVSALFLESFSVDSISRVLNFVIDNQELVHKIGIQGNLVGRKFFDYKSYSSTLANYLTLD